MEERKAIKPHNTPTSDSAWDGQQERKNVMTDQDRDYFSRIFAWKDPEKDPALKDSYRFIHHEVSDGMPGPANIRACQTGIAVLNGARGGTTIPREDYQGVWNHLARHLRDADREPAALRAEERSLERERRFLPVDNSSIRIERNESGETKIVGYAAKFEKLSHSLGAFREVIRPGFFRRALEQQGDIFALFNHDDNYILGERNAGTLRLIEDSVGLRYEIVSSNTQTVRDMVLTPIERGEIKGSSFGFSVSNDGYEWDQSGQEMTRVLLDSGCSRLYDVGPVTFPAYPDTNAAVRSLEKHIENQRAIAEMERKREIWDKINNKIDALRRN